MMAAMTTLRSVWGDLLHAMRALARERAFTLVCVVSLGIGIGAVVALATFGRTLTAPARGAIRCGEPRIESRNLRGAASAATSFVPPAQPLTTAS